MFSYNKVLRLARAAPAIACLLPPVFAATRAYVPLSGSNSVMVVNAADGAVMGLIPVGNKPEGVAFDPVHRTVYITNYNSNNVSVINTTTHQVFATVGVGAGPYGVAVTPDGSTVFVANTQDGSVSYFAALAAGSTTVPVVSAIPKLGSEPQGVAVTPDGKFLYVTITNSNEVAVINAATKKLIKTIATGQGPTGVAVMPTTSTSPTSLSFAQKAIVTNSVDGTVSIIDIDQQKVTNTINVGTGARSVATFGFPAESAFVLDSNFSNGTLSVLDFPAGAAPSQKTSFAAGQDLYSVATHPDGGSFWVSGGTAVDEYDSVTYQKTTTVPLASNGPAISFGQFIGPIFRESDIPELFRPSANLVIQAFGAGGAPQYVVANLGPGAAPEVIFTETLPAGVTFLGAKPSQGACVPPPLNSTGKSLTCNLGHMNAGETAMVQLAVTGTNSLATATVSSNFADDPDTSNNSVRIPIGVPAMPPPPPLQNAAMLSMRLTDAGAAMLNGGQEAAANLFVTMTLPSGVTPFSSASAFGCTSTANGSSTVMKCPVQAQPKSICTVTSAGLACQQPAPLTSLSGHQKGWIVFPVNLSDASQIASPVSLSFSTSTSDAIILGLVQSPTVTPHLGDVAIVMNAVQIFNIQTAVTNDCITDKGGDHVCLGVGQETDAVTTGTQIGTIQTNSPDPGGAVHGLQAGLGLSIARM